MIEALTFKSYETRVFVVNRNEVFVVYQGDIFLFTRVTS